MGVIIVNLTSEHDAELPQEEEEQNRESDKGSKSPPCEWDLEPGLQVVS